ncbi:MAG: dicarboxylate/amino acid:cation symporter [Bacteroidia bacterium]|jgi:Na+/H+-dicarboxylate symporter|nr:dicarboxylate/amino acid:cation symporter [Bacteroidia bacterium]
MLSLFKTRLPMHIKILLGIGAGTLVGLLAARLGYSGVVLTWFKPLGTIFVNLLKLLAVPLVLVSLVDGVTGLRDLRKLSSMGGRTLLIFLCTTVLAVTLGLVLVNIVRPGDYLSTERREDLKARFSTQTDQGFNNAQAFKERGPLSPIVDMVPDNLFHALSNNTSMLQVVFFALFMGVAIMSLPSDQTQSVRDLFGQLNRIVLLMVDYVMAFAPIGVFALIASLIADLAGNDPAKALELLGALSVYALTVVLGLALMLLAVYATLVRVFGGLSPRRFFRVMSPAQLLAFSTSSSNATLPVNLECAEKLGVREEVRTFVLPLGATVNMDGTSLYQAVATVFIAQAFGTDLTWAQQLTIVLTATLASIGSAGVPGAGMVMLVIVLQSVGLESAGIALVVAVDRILDMMRTVVNVTGDAMTAVLVDRWMGRK